MVEQNVIIEITDTEIRLLVGYVSNARPHIIHVATKPIAGLISNGEIIEPTTLSQILSSLREVRDPNSKSKLIINDVSVILPALGLNVFEGEATTNVVSNDSVIGSLDIENVVSQIQKEQVPSDSEIIEIIPDSFILDDGRVSTIPPIKQRSASISLKAKIHTLPRKIVEEYTKVIQNAHLNVNKFILSSYAVSELAKYDNNIPKNYILVNMGSEICDITLIGKDSPYGTIAFHGGGSDIVKRIVDRFGITPEDGLKLLTNNGYSNRELTFSPVIATTAIDGEMHEFTQTDLNDIILDYFATDFFPHFDAAFATLLSDYQDQVKQLPVVFTGGFSMMKGFDEFAKKKFENNQSIHFLSPHTIGARTATYSIIVGGLLVASSNKGALSEQRKKTKNITR